MSKINTFNTRKKIEISGKKYIFFDLNVIADTLNFDLSSIPTTLKVLLENLLRFRIISIK